MTKQSRGKGLTWKIARTFTALILLAGLMIAGIVYQFTEKIFREQANTRASLITLNLADAAAGHVLAENLLQLDALVTKHARLNNVAYAFIEDRGGKVIAHSLGNFSPELRQVLTINQRREKGHRRLMLRGKPVDETRAPILEGQLGTAHVGIWSETVQQEMYQALFSQIELIAVALFVTMLFAVLAARRLVRPFRRLTDIADRVSTGDLDTPIRPESRDEFGELTHSLERMRASLKAAMLRLERV